MDQTGRAIAADIIEALKKGRTVIAHQEVPTGNGGVELKEVSIKEPPVNRAQFLSQCPRVILQADLPRRALATDSENEGERKAARRGIFAIAEQVEGMNREVNARTSWLGDFLDNGPLERYIEATEREADLMEKDVVWPYDEIRDRWVQSASQARRLNRVLELIGKGLK